MMTFSRVLTIGGLLAALPLRAVYAPIPEPEQGKDLAFTAKAGVAYDSNLFGAAADEVDSMIITFAPRGSFNRSLTDQTFFSTSYGPTFDYFTDRPGKKLLDSHEATVRVAHAFSRSTTLDVFDMLTVSRNPESSLPGVGTIPGVTLNPDQSFNRNQLDGRFTTPLNPKATLTLKARSVNSHYRNDVLADALDRLENLYGISGDYAVMANAKAVAEYRRQDVYYWHGGDTKNKKSDYLMAGADYMIAKKVSLSARLGTEWRRRAAEASTTAPYAELSGKYDFSERSFVVGGYAYTLEETSDTTRFTDTKVHRLFANVQHAFTPLIIGSGSATYEPAVLQGRRIAADGLPQKNINEETVRVGVAVSYLPSPRWTVSLSVDCDRVYSEIGTRDLERNRVGLTAHYMF